MEHEQNEIHIGDYLRIIYKRRRVALAAALVVMAIALIGVLSATPVYMASTTLIIEKAEPNMMPTVGYYSAYDPNFYETQYQIIKSPAVARKVVDSLSLDKHYGEYLKDDSSALRPLDLLRAIKRLLPWGSKAPEPSASRSSSISPEALADIISAGIVVKPVPDSKAVTISYMSRSPQLTAQVANAVAKGYIDQILEMRMESSRYAIEWMKEKSDEERKRLDASERALYDYVRANDILTLENRVTVIPQQLTDLTGDLSKAQSRLAELRAVYDQIKIAKKEDIDTIPPISNNENIIALRRDITKAEQNILDLSKLYGKKHPMMSAAERELEMLNKKRTQEVDRAVNAIKVEYELAKNMVGSFSSRMDNTRSEAMTLNEKFVEYSSLKKEVETNSQIYDTLLKKIKEQGISEQARIVNVWMLKEAKEPSSPIKPQKARDLLVGLLAALGCGILCAFLAEQVDNTIDSPEELERRLRVPVIGVIPKVDGEQERIEKIVLTNPRSNIAEMYKSIRTAILLSSAEAPPKSLLITSVEPEDGKTSTSINLALEIANFHRKVLLIDADLRKPKLHRHFQLENTQGLSTGLVGLTELQPYTVHESPDGRLDLLTSGPVPPNPSELLGSHRMVELLRSLTERYDLVMLDSPPLLSMTDSIVLSKFTDATVLVVRPGKSTYRMLQRALKVLTGIKANLLGIVINGLDLKKNSYYSYYYYNYYMSDEGQEGTKQPQRKKTLGSKKPN